MKKKNCPQTANQNFNASDNSAIHALKLSPKKHHSRIYMLRTGVNGWTENETLYYCRLSFSRNYANELEGHCVIRQERLKKPNPDGISSHYHYRFTNRDDVQHVINLINARATMTCYQSLTQFEKNDILSLYPELLNAA